MTKTVYRDTYLGKIITQSIQTRWDKTYFYAYGSRDKVLVILEGDAQIPEDLTKSYVFHGFMTYSPIKNLLKIHTGYIEEFPERNQKEELRKMIEEMRKESVS